ncbi:MAG: DEAD/DEAH box helicase [Polyangiales bacterium]
MHPLAWLDDIALARVRDAFPALLSRLLERPAPYLEAPEAVGGAVRAALPGVAGRGRATVVLSRGEGREAWRADCTCRAWAGCEHAAELLIDLALSPVLRDALRGDGVDPRTLERLAAIRDAVRAQAAADAVAATWLPVRPALALAPPRYALLLPTATDPAQPLQRRCVGYDGTPQVELKVRVPGHRAALDPAALSAAALPPEDRAIVRLLNPARGNRRAMKASGVEAAVALEFLSRHARGRVALEGLDEPLSFDDTPLSLHLVVTRLPRHRLALQSEPTGAPRALYGVEGGRWEAEAPANDHPVDALEARWRSDDGRVELCAWDAVLFRGPFPRLWSPRARTFYRVAEGVDLDLAWHAQSAPAVELVRGHSERILRSLRRRLRGRAVRLPTLAEVGAEEPQARITLRVDGRPLEVTARLLARYPHGEFTLSPGAALDDDDDRRDTDLELDALQRLQGTALTWDADARLFRAGDDSAATFWRVDVEALRACLAPVITVEVPASLLGVRARPPVVARLAVSREGGLLEVAASFWSDGKAVELSRLREAHARRRRWVELDDRSLAALDDDLASLLHELPEDDGDSWRAKALVPLVRIGSVLRWSERAEGAEAMRAIAERLRGGDYAAEPELPAALAATLRPYQRRGLAWLQWLHGMQLGGVLADEMGLGKTVVALALACWVRERAGDPVLVVAPTSVVGGWIDACARFAPTLRARSLHGMAPDARAGADLSEVDVVITSWALLRRDAPWLASRRFSLAVYDEAQTVKSLDAATAQAAREVPADMRVALTGTPVENRLTELWAILDLCVPGALGALRSFERAVERPIAHAVNAPDGGDGRQAEAAAKLAALRAAVRPLILRRKKIDVLTDLPPRQDVELRCELSAGHRRLYDALAAVLREQVRSALAERRGTSRIAVFTALLRLRQMACDPRLVDRTLEDGGSKRALFLQHARAIAEDGRRALVFSQFVELLTLWRADLDREGIEYEYLDGATVDRAGAVRRFQEGDAPLFLISLKAGGTGLNLTAADTVILCDPWWNPAVEEQAGDRAHRIGQTRAVTVYRLLSKGTVEERVMALQDRKRRLAESLLSETDEPAVTLDDETLATLFADAGAP